MVRSSPLGVVAVALLVALAGCPAIAPSGQSPSRTSTATGRTDVSPTSTSTPTPTNATTPPVNRSSSAPGVGSSALVSVDGSLPVNATVVYRRVERVMGVNGTPPNVTVGSVSFSGMAPQPESYERALGIVTASSSGSDELPTDCRPLPRFATTDDGVRVDADRLSASEVELALAHAFAHSVAGDVLDSTNGTVYARQNASWERETLRMGMAVHVADAYARTHDVRWAGMLPSERSECLARTYPGPLSETGLQRYVGDRFVDHRPNDTANLTRLIAHPPRTDEQFLHGETPASESPVNLSVSVESDWAWNEHDRARAGEIAVRRWLQPHMGSDDVDAAATGWGNDVVVEFDLSLGSNDTGVAWVLRWDTPEDASEFYTAARYVETRLEDANVTNVRLVRQGEDTIVVLAGNESFVANATVSGSSADVTVSAP